MVWAANWALYVYGEGSVVITLESGLSAIKHKKVQVYDGNAESELSSNNGIASKEVRHVPLPPTRFSPVY
jgi:hypothetical protein